GPEGVLQTLLARANSPWAPLAVVDRRTPESTSPPLAPPYTTAGAVMVPGSAWDARGAPAVEAAVRRRSVPPTGAVVRYVAARLPDARAEELLGHAMDRGRFRTIRASTAAYRKLCRDLSRLGPLHATDWQWLSRLARAIPGSTGEVEPLARDLRTEARTLRAHLNHLFEEPLEDLCSLAPWEALMEQALRIHGYVRRPVEVLREIPQSLSPSIPQSLNPSIPQSLSILVKILCMIFHSPSILRRLM
ncbi:MAG: hypothetical protein AB7I33_10400, partial [Gemmatimonadales bacterium]